MALICVHCSEYPQGSSASTDSSYKRKHWRRHFLATGDFIFALKCLLSEDNMDVRIICHSKERIMIEGVSEQFYNETTKKNQKGINKKMDKIM
jgi:hypothetical protein